MCWQKSTVVSTSCTAHARGADSSSREKTAFAVLPGTHDPADHDEVAYHVRAIGRIVLGSGIAVEEGLRRGDHVPGRVEGRLDDHVSSGAALGIDPDHLAEPVEP